MTDLGQTSRTRQRRSRIVMALLVGLLVALGAAGALAQGGKSTLIGKLEGPEVVTDPAKFPKTFKEAPQLAALVKAGKLPPVAERIGQDPLVIKPLHEIGKYGGTWRARLHRPGRLLERLSAAARGPDHLMFWDYTGDKVVPEHRQGPRDAGRRRASLAAPAPRHEVERRQAVHRRRLRVLVRGHLPEQGPRARRPSAVMAINGKQGMIEKVDDLHRAGSSSPSPTSCCPTCWPARTDLAGQHGAAYRGMGGFAPAHYLKQFHPEVRSARPSSTRRSKEAKFDSWVRMFLAKNDWAPQPGSAGALALEDGDADQHADVDARAQPLQRLRGHRGQPAARTSTRWSLTLAENLEVHQPARDRRRVRLRRRGTSTSASCRSSSRTSRRATTRSTWIPATTAATWSSSST